jgi:hypothetical protein
VKNNLFQSIIVGLVLLISIPSSYAVVNIKTQTSKDKTTSGLFIYAGDRKKLDNKLDSKAVDEIKQALQDMANNRPDSVAHSIVTIGEYVILEPEPLKDFFSAINADPKIDELRIRTKGNTYEQTPEKIAYAQVIADFIATNQTLKYLSIAEMCLGDEGMEVFFGGIAENTHLRHLDTQHSDFGKKGCEAFLKALQKNRTLEKVVVKNLRKHEMLMIAARLPLINLTTRVVLLDSLTNDTFELIKKFNERVNIIAEIRKIWHENNYLSLAQHEEFYRRIMILLYGTQEQIDTLDQLGQRPDVGDLLQEAREMTQRMTELQNLLNEATPANERVQQYRVLIGNENNPNQQNMVTIAAHEIELQPQPMREETLVDNQQNTTTTAAHEIELQPQPSSRPWVMGSMCIIS